VNITKVLALTILSFLFSENLLCLYEKPVLTSHVAHVHMIQPIMKGGCFFNDAQEDRYKHMKDAVQIVAATAAARLFGKSYDTGNISQWVQRDKPIERSESLQVQWIGHASFLIQVNNMNILTDPVFYNLHGLLYPRKTLVGIDPDNLPHIDFVLISHNHRDHVDDKSLAVLKAHQPIMLVPRGTKKYFENLGFHDVREHMWWESCSFAKDDYEVDFTFVPGVHWSGRTMLDVHTSLWGGWIIKTSESTLYFAGDSGFKEEIFKAIAEYAGTIDCALLPIGPCQPRELMCHSHMSPEEAVRVFKVLDANLFIPMHWGTFGLGPDVFDTPVKELDVAWQQHTCATDALYKIKFGERVRIPLSPPMVQGIEA